MFFSADSTTPALPDGRAPLLSRRGVFVFLEPILIPKHVTGQIEFLLSKSSALFDFY
jgi:hypothetical protein